MTAYTRTAAVSILTHNGLSHPVSLYLAAVKEQLPLPAACALMEKESHGANLYGHDHGGALSGYPNEVTADNFAVFWWLVHDQGQTSNGVGPAQLTFPGFFTQMQSEGLSPWIPLDNMRFGFRLLKGYYDGAVAAHSPKPWITAGERYNGAFTYGEDLAAKVKTWTLRLAPAEVTT